MKVFYRSLFLLLTATAVLILGSLVLDERIGAWGALIVLVLGTTRAVARWWPGARAREQVRAEHLRRTGERVPRRRINPARVVQLRDPDRSLPDGMPGVVHLVRDEGVALYAVEGGGVRHLCAYPEEAVDVALADPDLLTASSFDAYDTGGALARRYKRVYLRAEGLRMVLDYRGRADDD